MAKGKLVADEIEHSTEGALNTQYLIHGTAKALITFDPASDGTIHRSHNVSSLVDSNTGQFLINVTSAFKDLHSVIVSGNGDNSVHNAANNTNEEQSTTQYKHNHFENNATVDCTDMHSAALGDILA
jgi:ATP-dependent protease Clp ATPase subunit